MKKEFERKPGILKIGKYNFFRPNDYERTALAESESDLIESFLFIYRDKPKADISDSNIIIVLSETLEENNFGLYVFISLRFNPVGSNEGYEFYFEKNRKEPLAKGSNDYSFFTFNPYFGEALDLLDSLPKESEISEESLLALGFKREF